MASVNSVLRMAHILRMVGAQFFLSSEPTRQQPARKTGIAMTPVGKVRSELEVREGDAGSRSDDGSEQECGEYFVPKRTW